MSEDRWDAGLYRRFEADRTRPAADLLARVPDGPRHRVVDLGCGPGNSTALLAARFPEAGIEGIDTSPDMLGQARARLPHISFTQADIAGWHPSTPHDLLFANAVLHWLPDHRDLFPRLFGMLAPGGALAAQMPDNLDEPSHRAIAETAREPRFEERLAEAAGERATLAAPADYFDWLAPAAASVDIWRTVYFHVMPDADAIVDWMRGAALTPYLKRLDEAERGAFLASYRERIVAAYRARPGGGVLLAFPRLFIVAARREG